MGSPTCDTKRTTHTDNAPNELHLRDNDVDIKIIIIIKVKERSEVLFSSSELDEEFYSGLNLSDQERLRLAREFYYPPHIAFCGNYYPRYKTKGNSHTGTSHVTYLARPYYSYLVPSRCSGYSKYVYITKM